MVCLATWLTGQVSRDCPGALYPRILGVLQGRAALARPGPGCGSLGRILLRYPARQPAHEFLPFHIRRRPPRFLSFSALAVVEAKRGQAVGTGAVVDSALNHLAYPDGPDAVPTFAHLPGRPSWKRFLNPHAAAGKQIEATGSSGSFGWICRLE